MTELRRIVVIHDRVEARGGATSLARLSALHYRKRGFEVTYLTGEAADEELAAAGVDVEGLGLQGLSEGQSLGSMLRGLENTKARQLVAGWIARNDTPQTAYHLHNWAQILSPSIFKPLGTVEARTVVSCHDFFNTCPNGGLIHFPSGQPCELKAMSAACWASQCDRRSTLHKYWRMARHVRLNQVADFASSRMHFVTLHEGMETIMREAGFKAPLLSTVRNPARAFQTTRISAEDNSYFLYVGRINREKGADKALELCEKAGIPLVLAGEGELSESLQARYPDATFAGFCDRSKLSQLAAKARMLIVPSRWREPFGLVTVEAAMSGLPVLISDRCPLAEDIARTSSGLAFDLDSDAETISGMKDLAANDERIAEMSRNAFSSSGEFCNTVDGWGDAFINLLEQRAQKAGTT